MFADHPTQYISIQYHVNSQSPHNSSYTGSNIPKQSSTEERKHFQSIYTNCKKNIICTRNKYNYSVMMNHCIASKLEHKSFDATIQNITLFHTANILALEISPRLRLHRLFHPK